MGGQSTTDPAPARPLLLAVDAHPEQLDRIEGELQRSFGADFRIRGELSAADARRTLLLAHDHGQRVAVVLVDGGLPEAERTAVLRQARTLHPDARRAMLMEWGSWADRETASGVLGAMAVGDINYYVLKPWIRRDELFHRTVAEFVQEWSRSDVANLREVVVIADLHCARGHAVRNLLSRNGIPSMFRELGSDHAQAVLRDLGEDRLAADEVLVWMPAIHGKVLRNPSDTEIAEAWGVHTKLVTDDRDFDLLVVGAGPAGLASASRSGVRRAAAP